MSIDATALLSRLEASQSEYDKRKIMLMPRLRGYFNELARGTRRGYDWYVAHNDMGYRVGYVRVPYWHPWFKLTGDELTSMVTCHYGLTYIEKGPVGKIPKFSYSKWIGFDCAHAGDAPDPELFSERYKEFAYDSIAGNGGRSLFDILTSDGVVRDQEYVEFECMTIIEQARMAIHHGT